MLFNTDDKWSFSNKSSNFLLTIMALMAQEEGVLCLIECKQNRMRCGPPPNEGQKALVVFILTLSCPLQGLGGLGCVPCPAGQYIQENTTECTPCPINTVVTDPLPYGPKSCIECGPGLTAPDGLTCTAQCQLDIDGMHFDLTNISR